MSVQPMRPAAAPIPARPFPLPVLRDVANGILFCAILGFGLLIPVVLPLYAYLSR